jgi:hypothetical protein
MSNVAYHLRQVMMLTRFARLTRNQERAAHLLRLAEEHKKLAGEVAIQQHRAVSVFECAET